MMHWRWPLVLIVAAAAGCSASDEEPEGDSVRASEELVTENQLVGRDLPAKTVSLTFDDGPSDRTTELAEFLERKNIKATFFINGMRVPGRQRHLDAIIQHGHILANHTQNHRDLTDMERTEILDEVRETDAFIRDVQPDGPWILRAPYGAWNGHVANVINGTRMKKYVGSVFWDIGGQLTSTAAADWACWGQGVSVERCGDLYMSEIRSRGRGVVLMHDIHSKTVDMVKRHLVPDLIAAGYKFVPLTAVPSVKRAIAGIAESSDDPCFSATLGKRVPENTCVQSTSNELWYRCVDGEWLRTTRSDSACVSRHPL
jgi:peptidoglycan/xylan/chitin deacetylase (PgdA/CDA1 family)